MGNPPDMRGTGPYPPNLQYRGKKMQTSISYKMEADRAREKGVIFRVREKINLKRTPENCRPEGRNDSY